MNTRKTIVYPLIILFLTSGIPAPITWADDDSLQASGSAGTISLKGRGFDGLMGAVPVKKLGAPEPKKQESRSDSLTNASQKAPNAWMINTPLVSIKKDEKAARKEMAAIENKATSERIAPRPLVPVLLLQKQEQEQEDKEFAKEIQEVGEIMTNFKEAMTEEIPAQFSTSEESDPSTNDELAKEQADFSADFPEFKSELTASEEAPLLARTDKELSKEQPEEFISTSESVMKEMIAKKILPDSILSTKDAAEETLVETPGQEKMMAAMLVSTDASTTEVHEGAGHWEDIFEDRLVIDEDVAAQIQALTDQIAGLQNEKNGLQNQITNLDNEIQGIQTQIENLDNRIERLEDLIDRYNDRIDALQARITNLDNQINAKVALYQQKEARWNQLLTQNIQMDQQAFQLRLQLISIPRPTRAQRSAILRQLRELNQQFRANIREMNQLRRDGLRLAREVRQLQRDKARAQQTLRDVINSRNRAQQTLDRLIRERADLEQRKLDKEREREDLAARIDVIDGQIADLQAQIADLLLHLYVTRRVKVGQRWVPDELPNPDDPTVTSQVAPEDPVAVDETHSIAIEPLAAQADQEAHSIS